MDIQHKEFRRTFRGVDPREVAAFLQQVADLASSLLRSLDTLKGELSRKNNTISDFRDREGLLKDTILAAQKTAQQMKANAEKQANIIISEAELKAEKIMTNAHRKLMTLQDEMEELSRHKVIFRTKLKGMIDSHLKLLELESDQDKEAQGKLSLFNPPYSKP